MIQRTMLGLVIGIAALSGAACSSSSNSGSEPSKSSSVSPDTTAAAVSNSTGGAASAIDCVGLKDDFGSLTVNWQLIIQLPNQASVAEWATLPVGSISEFGQQLDRLSALQQSDPSVGDSIAFMSGANEIVQRGLSGDETASPALAEYLGDDVSGLIMKQMPFGPAFDAAGC